MKEHTERREGHHSQKHYDDNHHDHYDENRVRPGFRWGRLLVGSLLLVWRLLIVLLLIWRLLVVGLLIGR